MDPLPSVDYAYNLVQQEETRLQVLQAANNNGGVTTDGIGAGLAVRGWQNQAGGSRGGDRGGTGRNRWSEEEDKSKLVCSHCKRKRHTKESCFELVGYPEWWEEKHGKPQLPRAPWSRGGHAAAVVGGSGATPIPSSGEQASAAAQSTNRTGDATIQSANKTGPANFITGGSGSIIGDWSSELENE